MDGDMWRWVVEDDVLQQNPNPVPWLSFFQRNPNSWAPQIYPTSFLHVRVDQQFFSLFLVWLGHTNVGNKG
jgi:hypothetical protein